MIFCGTQQHATDAICRAQVFITCYLAHNKNIVYQLQLALGT